MSESITHSVTVRTSVWRPGGGRALRRLRRTYGLFNTSDGGKESR